MKSGQVIETATNHWNATTILTHIHAGNGLI
jgi:hypothetical protein